MDFTFTRLVCTLRLESDGTDLDPFLRLKGLYPELFRMEAGCRGPACPGCRDGSCAWHRAFARELSSDPSAVKRFQKPSLPFVFELPPVPRSPNRGSELPVGLLLAGTAVNSLPLFLAAFRRAVSMLAGSGFAATLVSVATLDAAGRPVPLVLDDPAAPQGIILLTPDDLLAGRTLSADRVTVTFATPLRIVRDGRPLREIAFSDLVRGLLRRVSSLAYYYADAELSLDYRWLSERSAEVVTVSAAFRWTERSGGWSGVTGRAEYGGELGEFLPLLLLGELFHLGKGAGWGQGRLLTSL